MMRHKGSADCKEFMEKIPDGVDFITHDSGYVLSSHLFSGDAYTRLVFRGEGRMSVQRFMRDPILGHVENVEKWHTKSPEWIEKVFDDFDKDSFYSIFDNV